MEKESKENKLPPAPRKDNNLSQGMERTLLIAPMRLMRLFQPEGLLTIPLIMYLQTIQELCVTKRKVTEWKKRLQQLLSQRSGVPATHTVLVVVAPFFSVPFVTTTPRTYHKGQPYSSRSGYCRPPRKRNWQRV